MANFKIIDEKDSVYHKHKICPQSYLSKVSVISRETYDKHKIQETTSTLGSTLLKHKGIYVYKEYDNLIRSIEYEILGLEKPVIDKEIIQLETDVGIILPANEKVLINFYNRLVKPKKTKEGTPSFSVIEVKASAFGALLSIFVPYPEFLPSYSVYLLEPDNGIALSTEEISKDSYYNLEGPPTREYERRITVHLILLLMVKTFTSKEGEGEKQQMEWAARRISAMSARFGIADCTVLIETNHFNEICRLWSLLPVLRKHIFLWTFSLRNRYEEFSAASTLMYEMSMSTIRCIVDFLAAPVDKKSEAHAEVVILQESKKFEEVSKKVREELGGLWPYYRVVALNTSELNTSNFPNLSCAAVEYAKSDITNNPASYKYLVTPTRQVLTGIAEKAQTLETRGCWREKTVDAAAFSEELQEYADQLGLELDRLKAPKGVLNKLDPTSEIKDLLANLLVSYKNDQDKAANEDGKPKNKNKNKNK